MKHQKKMSERMKVQVLKCLLCAAMAAMPVASFSQIGDALKDIYPEVEKSYMKSLNGNWKLQVVQGIDDKDKSVFKNPDYDDTSWKEIPVPGNWEIYGFSKAHYESPDSLTGYYRTTFSVPSQWKGRRIVIRLDGVLRAYTLYVNGKEAGSWNASYNTCLFDITPYLRKKGVQTLALRVVSRFKGYEFDTYDDWGLMGIFRDVTLLSVPETHLCDVTISTLRIDEGKADVKFAFGAADSKKKMVDDLCVNAVVVDKEGREIKNFSLPLNTSKETYKVLSFDNPMLWTAETPNLYRMNFQLLRRGKVLQKFTQNFGIRQLTIDGKVVKINGKSVKFRGVTLHSTDPYKGKVIEEELTEKDMRLMKEASVNYIRCSHYAREPRFYELCDSLGFYVINEVSFGFGDKHLNDTTYRDILLTHADATVRRDKNHPSVMIWSIGNENPFTKMTGEVGKYVLNLDSTREICYPQVGSYFHSLNFKMPEYVKIFAPHYPVTSRLIEWASKSPRPIILTEYCHSLGNSFEDHDQLWNVIEKNDVLAGGSVWEWVDQAVPFRRQLNSRYGYVEDVYTNENGGFTMYGSKGTDGLLYADRTPLSNYYELRHNYARVFATDSILSLSEKGGPMVVHLVNRYDFLNLRNHVKVDWMLTADRDTVQKGMFSPWCEPHQTVEQILNVDALPRKYDKNTLLVLHLKMTDGNGYQFNDQTVRVNVADLKSRLLATKLGEGSPKAFLQGDIMMRTGRKLSMSEVLKVKNEVSRRYLKSAVKGVSIDSIPGGWHMSYRFGKEEMPPVILEGGVAMLLDKKIDRVQWVGNGPFATYPGKQNANQYGLHTMRVGNLYFEGNRMGVDAALLTDEQGQGLLMVCNHAVGVNFEQTDRGIVLSVNSLVSGLGPKFAKTAHVVRQQEVVGDFYLMRVDAKEGLAGLFVKPSDVDKSQSHFLTQYDTYLMKFDDIYEDATWIKTK